MTDTIADSSAYVGRYADGRPWPWWALGLLLPMAFVWGLVHRGRR